MGWFCTTSFGGDAFQMGSVESFFTLLLSPLHLALSLTAWWSPSLSLSFSLPVHTCSHTLLRTHWCKDSLRESHACAHANTFKGWTQMCIRMHTKTRAHTHTHVQRYSNILKRRSNGMWRATNTFRHVRMLCAGTYIDTPQVPHTLTYRHKPQHLNIHLNADVELQLLPHTANTFGWLFQLGLSGALLLFCTDSSFHRVRRDKAASSFFYYTHLKPLDCEKSFNAVPLRGEKNSLKKGAFVSQFVQVHFVIPLWMAFKGTMFS